MKSTRNRRRRALVLATLLVGVCAPAFADEPVEARPTLRPGERARFSSEKRAEDAGRTGLGSPQGPAMDGVRGSAIAPAPGAFGTDAGSPDDLRR